MANATEPSTRPVVRAASAVLDRMFAPHGASAYFRWLVPGAGSRAAAPDGRAPGSSSASLADDPVAPTGRRDPPPSRTRSALPSSEPTTGPTTGQVRFERSGLSAVPEGSILETAESAGLSPRHRCRRGICGTCTTDLISGSVVDARTGETTDGPCAVRICVSSAVGAVSLDL